MTTPKSDLLRGTLDLLVLEILSAGELHGYAIGQRIQEQSGELLRIEQGSLYPALYRMHKRGWLRSRRGTTETGRKARMYSLTRSGRRHLDREAAGWRDYARGVQAVIDPTPRAERFMIDRLVTWWLRHLGPRRLARGIKREMESHIAEETEALMAAGRPRHEAEREGAPPFR